MLKSFRSPSISTIRVRTVAAACLTVAIGILVAASLLLVVFRHSLQQNLRGSALARAQDIAALVGEGEIPVLLAGHSEDEGSVQIIDHQRMVLAASADLVGSRPISNLEPDVGETATEFVRGLPNPDDSTERYLVVALGATAPSGAATVLVATSLDQLEESVSTIRTLLLTGLPVLIALVAAVSWLAVGRALRPVDAIREQVVDITMTGLHRRVPEPRIDDEIGRLALAMNQMLDRLERSAQAQSRFVADASHELQSPLAASLTDLEVASAHPDEADWPSIAGGLIADNQRMSRLVRDLLFLARTDAESSVLAPQVIDLDDLVRDEVIQARRGASDAISIDVSGVVPIEVSANAGQLRRIVRNLLENAAAHAEARIAVALFADKSDVVLSVEDDGPGVPVGDRERIFDRFTRLDESRSRASGGTGLGLAIVRQIVGTYRGRISVEDAGTGKTGARFVVTLPIVDLGEASTATARTPADSRDGNQTSRRQSTTGTSLNRRSRS